MKTIEMMNQEADKVILKWSAGGLIGNLAPPPFDSIAVVSAMAKMGVDIAKVYEVDIGWDELKKIAWMIFKGVGAVNLAANFGTSLLKYIPGVNVWVALLIQPPIVAALSYATGKTYKRYFVSVLTRGKGLSEEEIKKIAKQTFKEEKKKKKQSK